MKKIISVVIVLMSLAFIYYSTPNYIKNALTHLFPDIDDYKFFKNREIKADNPISWNTAHDYMNYDLSKQERNTLESYHSIAYLIIQNDSIVYEEYWDGFNKDSYSNSFSAAKSIVSLLLGAAIQDGYIKNVNQPVSEFIPEFNDESYSQLHIKDLLTMSSGLNWNESYINPFSMTTQAYYGDNINELVLGLEVTETPSIEFKYSSGNTQLLALIIQNATGKTLSEYTYEKIWKPLGATNSALWSLDKENGVEKAYCCINSNARDFARIGKIILNNGYINNKQIFPEEYLKNSIEPASNLVDHRTRETVDFYGYHWWIINHEGEQIPYARGILGQYIFVLKKENAIVVRLGHNRSRNYLHHHPSDVYSYLNTAKRILSERNE